MSARLFRVLVRVSNIEEAAAFYDIALGIRGHRVSPGRHTITNAATPNWPCTTRLPMVTPTTPRSLQTKRKSTSQWRTSRIRTGE